MYLKFSLRKSLFAFGKYCSKIFKFNMSTRTSECKFNTKITKQTISSIELLWTNCVEQADVYKVESILNNAIFMLVYWGTECKCLISNLQENVCYKLRICALKWENNEYKIIEQSDIIKASTLPNIPTTISFHRAVRKSQEYLIKRYIITHSHLLDVPGPNGLTLLANAIVRGNKDMVEILLNAKANINLGCSITKRTPLQFALFHGHVTIAQLIIDSKADKNIRDCIGLNFVHYSIDGGDLGCIKLAFDNLDHNALVTEFQSYLLRAVIMRSSPAVIRQILNYEKSKTNAELSNKSFLKNAIQLATITDQHDILENLQKAL